MKKAVDNGTISLERINQFSPSPHMLHKATLMARKQQGNVHCAIVIFLAL